MKEFKGTPGPWRFKHSESKPAYNVVGTIVGAKYKIARCEYIEFDEVETKANALMISKAPEMLEALKQCRRILRDRFSTRIIELDNLIYDATNI